MRYAPRPTSAQTINPKMTRRAAGLISISSTSAASVVARKARYESAQQAAAPTAPALADLARALAVPTRRTGHELAPVHPRIAAAAVLCAGAATAVTERRLAEFVVAGFVATGRARRAPAAAPAPSTATAVWLAAAGFPDWRPTRWVQRWRARAEPTMADEAIPEWWDRQRGRQATFLASIRRRPSRRRRQR